MTLLILIIIKWRLNKEKAQGVGIIIIRNNGNKTTKANNSINNNNNGNKEEKKDHNRKKQLQMKENEKGKEKNVEKELMEEFKV